MHEIKYSSMNFQNVQKASQNVSSRVELLRNRIYFLQRDGKRGYVCAKWEHVSVSLRRFRVVVLSPVGGPQLPAEPLWAPLKTLSGNIYTLDMRGRGGNKRASSESASLCEFFTKKQQKNISKLLKNILKNM
jgi:hypothetical protein